MTTRLFAIEIAHDLKKLQKDVDDVDIEVQGPCDVVLLRELAAAAADHQLSIVHQIAHEHQGREAGQDHTDNLHVSSEKPTEEAA